MIWMHLLAIVAPPANFDAVGAAPNSHHVLLEDDKIRVLLVEVAPGATEPVHDHRWPSVMVFEQPQPITYITYKLVSGRPVETERFDAPAAKVDQTVPGRAGRPARRNEPRLGALCRAEIRVQGWELAQD